MNGAPRTFFLWLLFALASAATALPAQGGGVCVLAGEGEGHDLRPFMDVLEDADRSLGIDAASSPRLASRYGRPARGHFNFGFTSSALWFRFSLDARGDDGSGRLWVFDPGWNLYDTFELFVPGPGGGWRTYASGRLFSPPGGPEGRHFELPRDLGGPVTCYIRATSVRPLTLAPYVSTLDRALRVNGFKALGTGMVLAFFLTLTLVHLAVFVYTRNLKLRWLVPASASFGLFVAATSYQHLIMLRHLPAVVMSLGLVAQGALVLVVRDFLETSRHHRRLDAVLLACAVLALVTAACSFLIPERLQGGLAMYSVLPVALAGLWACLAGLQRSRTAAAIMLGAWLVAGLDILVYGLTAQGRFPFYHPAMLWPGFMLEGLAMSVLLAHLIRTIAVERQAAEATAEAKSVFLSAMSHEIRTPMTAILGFLDLALQAGGGERVRQYLFKVRASAGHLMGIINDILDLSRIEAGKIELEAAPFELEPLLRETADILATRAFENGNELVLSIQPGLPRRLAGDALRLRQVLVNLGGNAVKFTKGGTVSLSAARDEGAPRTPGTEALRFEVRDTGIGIAPEALPRLFGTFQQAETSTSRVYGGTGLGLNISRRLVRLMGGDIDVRSVPGQGSVFGFTVALETGGDGGAPLADFSAFRVLTVEDNEASGVALAQCLDELGARHGSAASAADAARMLAGGSFDLVLADWDLPDATGTDVVELLRGAGAPMALMTSPVRPEAEGREAGELGVGAVLAKPFTVSAVAEVLGRLSGRGASPAPEAADQSLGDPRDREAVRGLRVLLAEDTPSNRELLSAILVPAGLELEMAVTGLEAVNRVMDASLPPLDAVLMDIRMPEMDGYEATRAIRAHKRFTGLPIIAMTTNVMPGDRERSLEAGMDAHLAKPVDPAELFRTLGALRVRPS